MADYTNTIFLMTTTADAMPPADPQPSVVKTFVIYGKYLMPHGDAPPTLLLPDILADNNYGATGPSEPTGEPVTVTVLYTQRVWDITNTCWVYYSSTVLNASPSMGATVPTNSGNFLSGSHEILHQSVQLEDEEED